MSSVQIREAAVGDKPAWLRLRQALWPHCPEEKHALEIEQVLASGGVVFVAVKQDGKLVGFAEVSLRRDHVDGATISPVPYLEGWFVATAFRQQGVGRALMADVERWAIARGYTELASDTEMENALSIRLHKQFGFTEIDRNVTFLKKLNPNRKSRI